MGAITASIVFSWWIFDVSPAGNVALLLAVTPVFLLIGLSMGLLISSLAHSSSDAVQRSVLIMVPQLMLSDFLFPLSLMALPFRVVGELIPVTHYIRLTRGVYMKGQGFHELWPEVGILCVFLMLLVARVSRTIKRGN
jgi:ABC-2 type transport system permease protein